MEHFAKTLLHLGRITARYNFLIRNSPSLITPLRITNSYCTVQQVPKFLQTIQDLLNYIKKENRVNFKYLRAIVPTASIKDLSEDQLIFLFNCCGKLIPNEAPTTRNLVCQEIYRKLNDYGAATSDIYQTYIRVCTENGMAINYQEFIKTLGIEPDHKIFKALLNNLCEGGDLSQIMTVLNAMKAKGIALDERDFNALVLAHTITEGLPGAESVMNTMRQADIAEGDSTIYSLLKGLVRRKDDDGFDTILGKLDLELNEDQVLGLLEAAGQTGNLQLINKILARFLLGEPSKELILKIDFICLQLVNVQQPDAAMFIYQKLVKPTPDKKYGHFLLREMLISNTPTKIVIDAAKEIRDLDLNSFSLENTAEIALKTKKFDVALEFFDHFAVLRPHYFWPLLLNAAKTKGQLEVLNLVKLMREKGVEFNSETFSTYVIPFCDYSEPKTLIKSLTNLGFTNKDLIPAFLITLVQKKRLDLALKISQNYEVVDENNRIIDVLSYGWDPQNSESIVAILQKICENCPNPNDLVGDFLLRIVKSDKSLDSNRYQSLIKVLIDKKLFINQNCGQYLCNLIQNRVIDNKSKDKLIDSIHNLQDLSLRSSSTLIPHPRDMSLEQLECHLEELKHKGKETRGLLRRLIQKHCSLGNFDRVEKLRDEFLSLGYEETAGMKANLMHSYAKQGDLNKALELFDILKVEHSKFSLDEFKILDLATLLAKTYKVKELLRFLEQETKNRKVFGGTPQEKNCRNLLSAIEDSKDQKLVLDFLIVNGYCKPTNVILSPLIENILKKGQKESAINLYLSLVEQYKVTPMQQQMFEAVLDLKDETLLGKVWEVTSKVRGQNPTTTSLITAMAEKGLKATLKSFLSSNLVPVKDLMKQCNRWVDEGKSDVLITLKGSSNRILPQLDLNNFIMRSFSTNNDCERALAFYDDLVENEEFIDRELEMQLINLLEKCKWPVPDRLKVGIKQK